MIPQENIDPEYLRKITIAENEMIAERERVLAGKLREITKPDYGMVENEPRIRTFREDLLDEAKAVVTRSRTQQYAPPDQDFKNIAGFWSIILGCDISAVQVALCMDALKTARLMNNPNHIDSWVDKAGYAACGFEVSQISLLDER